MDETQEKIDWQSFLPKVMPALRASAATALGDEYEGEVEDVVMDTVSRFLTYKSQKYLPDFQSETSALNFLTKMIRNAAIECLSNLRRKDESLDTLEEILEDKQAQRSVEEGPYKTELEEALKTRLGPFTVRERLLLELYLAGYTSAEIAERLQEDVRVTRSDLNGIRSKVRYRMTKRQVKDTK